MPETHPTKLPNFILAGFPTSGTTALCHYLRQHPQIYVSPIKEPTSFAAADMLSQNYGEFFFRGPIKRDRAALQAYLNGPQTQAVRYWVPEWNDYIRLFRDVRGQIAIGEGSVSYSWLPSAASAIREKLPNVRLIFLLRDPADRLFSWYLMKLNREPNIALRDQLRTEMSASYTGGAGLLTQLDGGMYATHIQRFFDLFPRNQFRFYLYDDYQANPAAMLRDIFEFLGVDPNHSIDTSLRHNRTRTVRFPALHSWRKRLLGNMPLTNWLPASAAQALSKFYYGRRKRQKMKCEDRRLIIDYYREEILRTQDLIGTDLSAWLL